MGGKGGGRDNAFARFSFVVAVFLACSLGASADYHLSDSQPITAAEWQPIPGTWLTFSSPGIVTVGSRRTFWSGAIAYPPIEACNYRLDADARLHEGGSGYGLLVRASLTNGAVPNGQGIQYDQGMSGLRDVLLPSRSETGEVKPFTIDSEWHHISVSVVGNQYQTSVDGQVIFSGSTPTSCGNGIVIRVWRSIADFRNVSITPIKVLPGSEEFVRADSPLRTL